jgi:hypothetical protein
MVSVGRMLSLCNCEIIMVLQMANNQYFYIMTLQLYQPLISVQSVLKEIILCVFLFVYSTSSITILLKICRYVELC